MYAVENALKLDADVLGRLPEVVPSAPLRYLETVVLGESCELLVAVEEFERGGTFLSIGVADPLEEKDREYVRLEIRRIYRAS